MTKPAKAIFLLGLFLALIVFFSVVIANQEAVSLSFLFIPMTRYSVVGPYMMPFLFWTGIGLMILTVLAMIIVLFFPAKMQEISFSTSSGKLIIQKKALERFILQAVRQNSFLSDARAKVKLTRRKLKIEITGRLRPENDLLKKQTELGNQLRDQIQELLGIERQIQVKVLLKEVEFEKKKVGSEPRVV